MGYQDIQDWMCKNPTQDKLHKFLDINIEVAQVTPSIHSQKRPQVTLQGATVCKLALTALDLKHFFTCGFDEKGLGSQSIQDWMCDNPT